MVFGQTKGNSLMFTFAYYFLNKEATFILQDPQIYYKALVRFMDFPALACTSNLHEPHQNKNHSLNAKHHLGQSEY